MTFLLCNNVRDESVMNVFKSRYGPLTSSAESFRGKGKAAVVVYEILSFFVLHKI